MGKGDILLSEGNEYITLDATRRMLHISKRKCAALLQNGTIPCIETGKKTRRYLILRDDVIAIIKLAPKKKKLTDHTKPAIPYISWTAPEGFREWLDDYWSDIPDVLTQEDVMTITGYSQSAVSAWMVSGKLETVMVQGVPTTSRKWLIDFMCGTGCQIRRKSRTHIELIVKSKR